MLENMTLVPNTLSCGGPNTNAEASYHLNLAFFGAAWIAWSAAAVHDGYNRGSHLSYFCLRVPHVSLSTPLLKFFAVFLATQTHRDAYIQQQFMFLQRFVYALSGASFSPRYYLPFTRDVLPDVSPRVRQYGQGTVHGDLQGMHWGWFVTA